MFSLTLIAITYWSRFTDINRLRILIQMPESQNLYFSSALKLSLPGHSLPCSVYFECWEIRRKSDIGITPSRKFISFISIFILFIFILFITHYRKCPYKADSTADVYTQMQNILLQISKPCLKLILLNCEEYSSV